MTTELTRPAVPTAEARPAADTATVPRGRTSWWARHGGLLQLAFALLAFDGAVWLRESPSASIVVIAFWFLVPGRVLLRALGIRAEQPARAVVYDVGTSVALTLLVVLAVNAAGPPTGLERPLSTWPVVGTLNAVVLILAVAAAFRRATDPLEVPRRLAPGAAVLIVPVLALFGAMRVDNVGSSWLVTAALALAGVSLIGGLLAALRGTDGFAATTLYASTLAMLWSYSVRTSGFFGFDIRQEYASLRPTAAALRWLPQDGDAYTAMLSITAWPTALWQASGVAPDLIFKVVVPAVFALYPVAVFLLARQYAGPAAAMVATVVLVMTVYLAPQLPALVRQEVGLLLFAVLVLAALDPHVPRRHGQLLVLVVGAAMVVSHYSTTYVALLILVAARGFAVVLAARTGRSRTAIMTTPVVAALVAMTVVWTGPITSSGANVTSFADRIQSQGLDVLPNAGGSLLGRWLGGNTAADATPRDYLDAAAAESAVDHPWMNDNRYSAGVQADFPAVESTPDTASPLVPGLGGYFDVGLTALRQLANLAVAAGVALLAWAAWRRRRPSDLVPILLATLALAVFMRVSGTAAFSYNTSRFLMQVALLFAPALAVAATALKQRLAPGTSGGSRRASTSRAGTVVTLAAVMATTLVYLDASGLAARGLKGSLEGNLSVRGEYAERFAATDEDLAAARWVNENRRRDSIIFSDQYGLLNLESLADRRPRGLFGDIAPGALDSRALVLATDTNIRAGRARGTADGGRIYSVYQYPTGFFDTYKQLVLDTGTARVYR